MKAIWAAMDCTATSWRKVFKVSQESSQEERVRSRLLTGHAPPYAARGRGPPPPPAGGGGGGGEG